MSRREMVEPDLRLLIDLAPLRRSRDFRTLMGGQVVSVLGTQMTAVAVAYQVYRLTHSSLDVGLVSLTQLLPLILGGLVGGSAVDAVDRRRSSRRGWPVRPGLVLSRLSPAFRRQQAAPHA